MIVALFAGRPLCAATMVWKLVSPSPGMVVWTSSTSGSASRIASASMACSRTASDDVPDGGAMLTWRIFSEPALMNWVGRQRDERQRGDEQDAGDRRRRPSLVQRERRANVMVGV